MWGASVRYDGRPHIAGFAMEVEATSQVRAQALQTGDGDILADDLHRLEVGVYDFVKYSSYSYYPKNVLGEFKEDVIKFAKSEGLDAHANSVAVRFEEE